MKRFLLYFYNVIVVPILFLGFIITSFFNPKVRRGMRGRKKNPKKNRDSLPQLEVNRPKILIHVSSYGEFLQAKPVLNQLKRFNPDLFIIVSIFSPSGYDNIHIQSPVDLKCYLPFDSYFQMKKFVSIISPNVTVIVRHDIWPNFVWRLSHEKIPLVLIDASLPQKSSRFWPILKGLNKNLFSCMEAILIISDEERRKFRQLVDDPHKISVIGDTKYDQVFERSQNLDSISLLLQEPSFKQKRIMVVGSSWPSDEDCLIPAFQKLIQKFDDLIMIIAPHEIESYRIEEIKNRIREAQLTSIRYSQYKPGELDSDCLIIDQIGLLANIYYLGKVAFVGGSFHYKIHNVLEPAVYGIPVLFGPKMTNSSEAQNLLKHDAAILVKSTQEIVDVVTNLLENPDLARQYGERAKQVVMQNVGSSEKIAQFLLKHL